MSDNLDLDQVSTSQNQKEATINDKGGQLDAALTETATYAITSSNARTLTDLEVQRVQFLTVDEDGGDPATAAIMLTFPAIKRGTFELINDTAFDVTATISGQSETPPVIAAGDVAVLSSDGSDIRQPAGKSDNPYGPSFCFLGVPTSSQEIFRHPTAWNYTLPASLTGSVGKAKVAATAETIFSIQRNDVEIGTMTFAIAATVPTFAAASPSNFVANTNWLTVIGPATPDATLANISMTLKGTRV